MFKKVVQFISFILCVLVLCSCSNTNLPGIENKNQNNEHSINKPNTDDPSVLKVIRYPMLGDTGNTDYSDYYESGLLYPEQSEVKESKLHGASRNYIVNNTEYTATYSKSVVYSDSQSSFLKRGNYDEYVIEGKVDFQVFRETGFLKKVFIYKEELDKAETIVCDFSEAGLRSVAELVLSNLYGTSIINHLNNYYEFDFARLIEYANDEQNRYVVSYRAYLNDIPTDDVIYVQFSLSGSLMSVSAQKYLQYLNVDETSLKSIDELELAIQDSLAELDYSRVTLRENDAPCYYTMNSEGEVYYVMEWDAFKSYGGDTGVTCVEVMAVKAS